MAGVATQFQSTLSGASDTGQAARQAHGQQVTEANQLLAAQLEKIQALGKEIEKVLHIQQTVDNTIKSTSIQPNFMTGGFRRRQMLKTGPCRNKPKKGPEAQAAGPRGIPDFGGAQAVPAARACRRRQNASPSAPRPANAA